MIKTSTQVELKEGGTTYQWITFDLTTEPTAATIYWEVAPQGKEKDPHVENKTVEVTATDNPGIYQIRTSVPASEFTLRLDTEDRSLSYESDWKDNKVDDDVVELVMEGTTAIVPYCDLTKLDLKYYDRNMAEIVVWDDFSRWLPDNRSNGYIDETSYGEPTLVYGVGTGGTWARIGSDSEWTDFSALTDGFYYVELLNHTPLLTDDVARRTITRDSLYKKKYRGMVQL